MKIQLVEPKRQCSISRRQVIALCIAAARKLVAQGRSIPKIDLFPGFFHFWQQTGAKSSAEAATQFLQLVVKPNSEYYDAFAGTVSLDRAARYVEQVRPLVPAIKDLHDQVGADFDRKEAKFRNDLPDFRWQGSVLFMPNLFGFDAGGGSIEGRDFLVFGLDTIAKFDGPQADLSVLISHELFHKYYASFHHEWEGKERGRNIPLYWLVWAEGLATFASQRLNPTATSASIFRSATLAPSCEQHLKSLSISLQDKLDSTSNAQVMEWMSGQHRSSHVPPRAGYYLGWRIAHALGKERTLRELARLPEADVHRLMAQELRRFST